MDWHRQNSEIHSESNTGGLCHEAETVKSSTPLRRHEKGVTEKATNGKC